MCFTLSFLVNFFAVSARLRSETASFVLEVTTIFLFFSSARGYSPQEFSRRTQTYLRLSLHCPQATNGNTSEFQAIKNWTPKTNSMECIFKWRLRSPHRRCKSPWSCSVRSKRFRASSLLILWRKERSGAVVVIEWCRWQWCWFCYFELLVLKFKELNLFPVSYLSCYLFKKTKKCVTK